MSASTIAPGRAPDQQTATVPLDPEQYLRVLTTALDGLHRHRRACWDIATKLEEAAAVLHGVLEGLELTLGIVQPPEPERLLRVLRDRFAAELDAVDTQWHALYDAAASRTAVA